MIPETTRGDLTTTEIFPRMMIGSQDETIETTDTMTCDTMTTKSKTEFGKEAGVVSAVLSDNRLDERRIPEYPAPQGEASHHF